MIRTEMKVEPEDLQRIDFHGRFIEPALCMLRHEVHKQGIPWNGYERSIKNGQLVLRAL